MRYLIVFLILMLLVVGGFAQENEVTITITLTNAEKKAILHHNKTIKECVQEIIEDRARQYMENLIQKYKNEDFETMINDLQINPLIAPDRWYGLGMNVCPYSIEDKKHDGWIDTLLANGFNEIRETPISYQDTSGLANAKVKNLSAIAKGARVVWGVSSNSYDNPDYTITAANYEAFRTAIKSAAQWAQDNGIYEFQIGNEEGYHVDGDTMTVAQIITNLKSVATEVQEIFTNGNVSYSCGHDYISNWITVGKGDMDILASNVYFGGDGYYDDSWKTKITNLVNAFGVDGTCLTEFNLSWSSLNDYSTDEAVQAKAISEMINYIKASGMTRAFYHLWYHPTLPLEVLKVDGTYRLLWDSLLNSD